MADVKEHGNMEAELHVEIVPGTEVMRDVGSHHFIKGNDSHRVLVPQPSEDPNDPLNWSSKWKSVAITTASIVTMAHALGSLAIAPIVPSLMVEFNRPLPDIIRITGISSLTLGFCNFIWIPMSVTFGRRPTFIISTIINLIAQIVRAESTSYSMFVAGTVLNGIGAGPAEVLMPDVITDIFFLHDRGKWYTFYWVLCMGSVMLGPIIAGPMADGTGWRSFFWLNTGLNAVALLVAIFAFPETRYKREILKQASNESSEKDLRPVNIENTDEKLTAAHMENVEGPTPVSNMTIEVHENGSEKSIERGASLGKGKPAKWQWKLFQPNSNAIRDIAVEVIVPFQLHLYPICQLASFLVGWGCGCFFILNMTQSQAFAAPPYNYSQRAIGTMNVAMLIGALVGLVTAGPLSDWISDRLTKKNNGIREPEMRLLTLIPYALIMFFGNVIVSVGWDHGWPWPVIVVIGYGCAGIHVAAIPSIGTTYAVDSYKPVGGSILVMATINKNLWGYGLAEFVPTWAAKVGFMPPILMNAGIALFICCTASIFWFYGKTFRRWSSKSWVHTR